jgi:hypothetical protein
MFPLPYTRKNSSLSIRKRGKEKENEQKNNRHIDRHYRRWNKSRVRREQCVNRQEYEVVCATKEGLLRTLCKKKLKKYSD